MVAAFNVLKNKEQLQNQTVSTGGDYTPPAEGLAKLRFVSYVETGKQRSVWKGVESFKDQVSIVFELHGKKWEPKKLDDGTIIPQRITVKLNRSTSSKAAFYKLFLKMRNDREEIQHMAEMLGEGFMGKIVHRPYTMTVDGKEQKRIAAELVVGEEKAWTITPPYVDIPVMEADDDGNQVPTGEYERRPQSVPEPISELRLFIWDLADKEQWDSIYIAGEHEGKSKNVLQLLIVKAKNFVGSPAEAVASGSKELLALAAKGVADDSDSGAVPEGDGEDGDAKTTKSSGKGTAKTTKEKPKPDVVASGDDLSDID